MKLDMKKVYEDRLGQIDIDIKKLVRRKDWNGVKALRSERIKVMAQIMMLR